MSYPGSKGQEGVWQNIIGQMPPHSFYVEPFFGSGQVWRMKRPAFQSFLIDRDGAVFKSLNDAGPGVTIFPETDALVSLRQIFLTNFCPIPNEPQTLIYADPPYMLSTRAGRRYYKHELSDDDHGRLLDVLRALKCRVLLSHPPCQLYNERLKDWRCILYRTMTRGGMKPDALWCNFPEPDTLHDWRFAGKNYRQRLYLNRLRRRWLAKLAAMKPRQRGFVLNAILEAY